MDTGKSLENVNPKLKRFATRPFEKCKIANVEFSERLADKKCLVKLDSALAKINLGKELLQQQN